MGSGAARKRASRQKARTAAPTTTQAATWGSAKTDAPSFAPGSRAQLLQGWQSLSNQDQSFTLNQEARNTHRSAWNESNRLRNNAIQFVSGGNLSQDKQVEDEKNEGITTENVDCLIEEEEKEYVPSAGPVESRQQEHPHIEDEALGTSNTKVEVSITTQVGQLNISSVQRKPSFTRGRSTSDSSTSSSEVILFAGRGNPRKERKQSSTPPTPQTDTPTSLRPVRPDNSCSPKPPLANTPSLLKPDAAEFVPIQTTDSAARYPLRSQGVLAKGGWTKKQKAPVNHADQKNSRGRPRRGRHALLEDYDDDEEEEEEEEVIRDYIENMKESRDSEYEAPADEHELRCDYKGSCPGIGKAEAVPSTAQSKVRSTDPDNEWNSDDLRDFDELETSDDELIDVGGVFARRERQSGLQYLVTPVGQSTDFAKWILEEKLTSVKIKELIFAFEETHPEAPSGSEDDEDEADIEEWEDSASENSEERALNDLIRDHESEHEENERILTQTSHMTDAELARILNKQAELVLDTDDVVLFDGAFEQSEDFIPFSTKKHTSNRTRAKRNRPTKDTFPSAEAFADVLDEDPYNGFDVMDFERPSLKPKKKGRKSANGLPFELEDDELADRLAQSWAKDRSKKAAKKAEREELRQAGLLGAKVGKGRVDVQTKYKSNGMDMDQVKVEIRAFLLDNERETLALASMASPQRAQVHLLAKALYLESHSQGKGDARFPILTKTAFSGRYDEHNISQIDALLAKRKFSSYWGKTDKAAPRAAGGKARRSGGGGGVAAGATYMDGDVVGAAAPELGSENRGRAMLEKMGWSSGMGIGKVGNKGSVEVIKHVVKNSKAGLG
jgi:R3H domain/G-patch domain